MSRVGCYALLIGVLSVAWMGPPAEATVFRSGGEVVIPQGQVIDDDLFATGQSVLIQGTVQGDVWAAANTVRVPGRVGGNLLAFAQTVDVSGAVDGSLRAASQTTTISGSVARNAALAAQSVTLAPPARVGRDLHAASQWVDADGRVGGRADLAANTARVGGTVAGNLRFDGGRLSLGPNARVGGDLITRASQAAVLAPGAVVAGETQRLPAREGRPGPMASVGLAGNLLMGLAFFVLGAIALWLLPRFVRGAADALHERPGWSALWGFVVLFAVPTAAVMAAITVIGLPLSLVVMALWGLVVLLSSIPVAIFLGRRIAAWVNRGRGRFSAYESLALGMLVLAVLLAIPIVRGLVVLAVVLFGVGMLVLAAYQRTSAPGAGVGAAPA